MTRWLTSEEARDHYGVSMKTIRLKSRQGLIARTRLPSKSGTHNTGGIRYGYSVDDCDKYLTKNGRTRVAPRSLTELVTRRPWTAEGLRELRV